jgi:hypothetical protein
MAQILGETAGPLEADYICRSAKRGLSGGFIMFIFGMIISTVNVLLYMHVFAKSKEARILNLVVVFLFALVPLYKITV